MAEDDVHPTQIDDVEILNTDMRLFKSWGSVEVRDRENDLLPMDEFRKIMPVIMKRGGILMDRHSNRQVGKILNFEFKEKETPEGMVEGLMITGEIFRDYEHDDMIWEGIKNGIYKGLSFGGRNKMKDVKFDKSGLTNILTKLEGFEFSLVPGMGNQEATMEQVNFLAKSNVKKAYEKDGAHVHAEEPLGLHNHPEIEKEVMSLRQEIIRLDMLIHEMKTGEELLLSKEDIKKPFADYKDFDDCVSKNQDKDDPKAFCAAVKMKVEDNKGLTKNDSSLLQSSDKSNKYIKRNDVNKSMEADEIKKQNEMIEKNTNSIVEINKTLGEISETLKLLKQEKEEDDEDKEKKKTVHEDDEDKEKKKENDDEDKDKKPEEELEKEGEKKVQLPKVPAEETGGGKPAEGGEGEDVKFVEKSEFEEVKKQLADLVNKGATTPRPSQMINKAIGKDKPKNQKDIAKLLVLRNQK